MSVTVNQMPMRQWPVELQSSTTGVSLNVTTGEEMGPFLCVKLTVDGGYERYELPPTGKFHWPAKDLRGNPVAVSYRNGSVASPPFDEAVPARFLELASNAPASSLPYTLVVSWRRGAATY